MEEKFRNSVVDMCSAPYPDGRRKITVMLHEIYPEEGRWNRNGITWLEPYVIANAESIRGMPFCVRYWDEGNGIPYDHGFSGQVEDGMPVYEDSSVVGVAEDYEIRDVTIDGETHRVLCATGVLYQQRCPNFVKWLEEQLASGIQVYSSIEIVAPRGAKEIEYRDGWKQEGRIPTKYVYSGHSFLTVLPADDQSIVLELNQKTKTEVEEMDEHKIVEIAEEVEKRVKALLENAEADTAVLEAKDAEIAALAQKVAELEADNQAKEEAIACANEAMAAKDEKIAQLEGEVAECKRCDAVRELDEAIAGFEQNQKDAAKEEIEAFNADPIGCGHTVASIKQKIEACAYQAMMAAKQLEVNSANQPQVIEVIGAPEGDEYDFDKIFVE